MGDRIIIREERHREHAINRIVALKIDPAAPMEVTIKPYKKNRSLEQNNLMWDWFTAIANHTHHSPEGIHQMMMVRFLKPVLHDTPDGVIPQYSTSKLTVKEMSEFLENIDHWSGSLAIPLTIPPHPDDRGR